MKLTNEFTVAVPPERVWDTLIDIERVAGFLPGAKIEPGDGEGVFDGQMRVKLGPVTTTYRGTARLARVDESTRTADIAVEAREAKGQGTASAVIHNRVAPANGGSRVTAETDLQVTGRQAQFGRGIMQDVAGSMLNEFARRFERHLLEGDAAPRAGADGAPGAAASGAAASGAAGSPGAAGDDDADEALELGSILGGTATVRYAGVAACALLVLALLLVLVRGSGRRRQVGFRFDLEL